MKRTIFSIAAVAAMGVLAADLAVWEGAAMSAWTNNVMRWENPRVTAEGLAVDCIANDPQLYARPPAPFRGECNQYVEITVRSGLPGKHEFFWCSEKGGGCTRERHAEFYVRQAGAWETHKVRPGWIGEGRITCLRIDPPDSLRGAFEVKRVRVYAEGEVRMIDTAKVKGIVFEAQTAGQIYASLTWHTDASPGRKLLGFTTSPDGARHTYWFDFTNPHNLKYRFAGKKSWSGTAYMLAVEQVKANKALSVEKLHFIAGRPDLPPDIGVTYAGPELAIPRTGRPLALELILRNYGTAPARNVRFALDGLPPGCRVLDAADLAPAGEIGACEGWDSVGDDWASGQLPNERRFRVTLSDPGTGRHTFGLSVSADGMPSRHVPVTAEVLPSLGLAKAAYVRRTASPCWAGTTRRTRR